MDLLDIGDAIPSPTVAARLALFLAALLVATARFARRGVWLAAPLAVLWLAVVAKEFWFDANHRVADVFRMNALVVLRLAGAALAPAAGALVGWLWRRRAVKPPPSDELAR